MSCTVCHRMICRCSPDVSRSIRIQEELHEQIGHLQYKEQEYLKANAALASALQRADSALELICVGLVNSRETAMRARETINDLGLPHAQAVPEGWQLVPKEATEVMKVAFHSGITGFFHDCYRSMLAAAPKPEAHK